MAEKLIINGKTRVDSIKLSAKTIIETTGGVLWQRKQKKQQKP